MPLTERQYKIEEDSLSSSSNSSRSKSFESKFYLSSAPSENADLDSVIESM